MTTQRSILPEIIFELKKRICTANINSRKRSDKIVSKLSQLSKEFLYDWCDWCKTNDQTATVKYYVFI